MRDLLGDSLRRRDLIEVQAIEMTIVMIKQKIEMMVAVHMPNTCRCPGDIYQRTYSATFTYERKLDSHNLPYVQYELLIEDPPVGKYGRCEEYHFAKPDRLFNIVWEINQKRAKEFALNTLKHAGINAYIYSHEWPSTFTREKHWVSIYY